MKVLIGVFLLSVCSVGYGETTVLYQPGDKGVTVIVHGMDSDAKKLYEAMNVEEEDALTVVRKSILLTRMKTPILDLACNKSKATDATTCTIKFMENVVTTIDPTYGTVKFEIIDSYAAPRVANLFVKTNSNEVFASENGKLKIWKDFSSYGQVAAFTMTYEE